jgi:hypothetical protein
MTGTVLNFLKLNTRWLIIGVLLIILGYIIMAWDVPGALAETKAYAWHKLTLSPLVLLLGYIAIGVSIMIKPGK